MTDTVGPTERKEAEDRELLRLRGEWSRIARHSPIPPPVCTCGSPLLGTKDPNCRAHRGID